MNIKKTLKELILFLNKKILMILNKIKQIILNKVNKIKTKYNNVVRILKKT